jgi:L-lactate utilization protein LutB
MDVEVMDAISALKQGDIAKAVQLSFDCTQCGLCTSRCMGELPQYHIFQLARRIYAAKMAPKAGHLHERVGAIAAGKYDGMLRKLMEADTESLRKLYMEREMEPEEAREDWMPAETRYL